MVTEWKIKFAPICTIVVLPWIANQLLVHMVSMENSMEFIFVCLTTIVHPTHYLATKTLKMYPQSECASFKNGQSIYFLQNIDHSSRPNVKNCKVQNLVLVPESKGTPISTNICPIPLDMYYCTTAYKNLCAQLFRYLVSQFRVISVKCIPHGW